MGKSLTETAKAILMKEGVVPSVSSSDSNPDRDVALSTPNKATLRPGSQGPEGRFSTPGSTPPAGGASVTVEQPKAPGAGENVGAKVSAGQKKDTTIKGAGNSGEKSKKKAEVMEEDAETEGEVVAEGTLDEQIEAYIEQLVAEGHDEDTIMEAIEHYFGEQLSEETEETDPGFVAEEEESYQVDMSEHIEALFAGEELSEEFKEKATAIFEAAVSQKIEEEIAALEEAYAETLEEHIEQIQEELSSNVDDYLNYVVEQWVSENEVAIEAGLRSELTEDFISGLRNLFAEHYIDIPEDKVSVVEEMGSKVSELEEKLNEEIERNVQLTKYLNESKHNEIVAELCEGLTSTQAAKLRSLSEGLEFTSVNEFAQKVNILRENYFADGVNSTNSPLDKAEVVTDGSGMIAEELQGPMAAYVRTLGKKLPN
ncbi:prohead core protein [uncultured Caudovirales phage]|uniref:Prohead core protein n=1 Tax=uncultured Caudovirales phage TaxID=2100421 RepID=A0A6J5S9P8_9CAUD|nr:prohead core protein [uncultured Caudovirales phage]CAB4176206.1 prohead core protein [uncultured Caudovirales phage]CAB4181608.1 prohead core protein [uncultured Caudovirales phage]CAB4189759.1 prohead core protein [uncultured Caudovirales phage]CAB4210343.1 prohead core protein [uncultured Caudovirales phage]